MMLSQTRRIYHKSLSLIGSRLMSTMEVPTLEHPEISNAKISKDGDHMQGYLHLENGEHIYFQSSGLRGLYDENIDKETTVVLFHGKKYNSQTWNQNKTLQFLLKHKYGNIAFDLPGFGNSSGKRHEFEDDDTLDWIVQCLQKLEIQRDIVLVFPSWSGLYGLQWALHGKYNQYLNGIIPIAPAFCERFDANIPIQIPTCIVYGEKDETGLHNVSNEYLTQIPDHQIMEIKGAPHACYLKSNARKFHQILIDFLDQVEPSQRDLSLEE